MRDAAQRLVTGERHCRIAPIGLVPTVMVGTERTGTRDDVCGTGVFVPPSCSVALQHGGDRWVGVGVLFCRATGQRSMAQRSVFLFRSPQFHCILHTGHFHKPSHPLPHPLPPAPPPQQSWRAILGLAGRADLLTKISRESQSGQSCSAARRARYHVWSQLVAPAAATGSNQAAGLGGRAAGVGRCVATCGHLCAVWSMKS